MTDTMHPCPKCGQPTPDERHQVMGTLLCTGCTPQGPRLFGAMIYDHKTGGVLEVCNEDQFMAIKAHNDPSKDKDLEAFTP